MDAMRRMSPREIEEMQDEHIRRMGEPEPLRSLRLQKERIEHERAQATERELAEIEAARLRREIRDLGEEPCA